MKLARSIPRMAQRDKRIEVSVTKEDTENLNTDIVNLFDD
jgi:hypothetical protein